jgi:hypothetical protein
MNVKALRKMKNFPGLFLVYRKTFTAGGPGDYTCGPQREKKEREKTTMAQPKSVPQDCSLAIAIGAPDVVKMLIIGRGGRAEQIAGWAAKIAENAQQPGGFNARCAVWITDVAGDDTATLETLVQQPYPTVAVLERDNTVSEVITDDGSNIDPIVLEVMYLKAGA